MSTTRSRDDGRARRDDALDLLETQRERYILLGRRALLRRLLDCGTATADDVRAAVDLPPRMDAVCLGAVPGALVRAGIIARAGYATTGRPEAHARPVSVWRLVDRAKALAWLGDHPAPAETPAPRPAGPSRQGWLW